MNDRDSRHIVEMPGSGNARGFDGALIEDDAGTGPDWSAIGQMLWTGRKRLVVSGVLGGALALALAFVLPPVYVANIAVLDAPRSGGGSALAQIGLQAEMLGIKASSGGNDALTYPDILRSRRLLVILLESRFTNEHGKMISLIDHVQPGKPSPQRTELAVIEMRKRLDIALDRKTNLLRVGVHDRDPVLAAAVANRVCSTLQDVLTHAMMTQAGANRRFVEQRLSSAEHDLAMAEGSLRAFREANLHVDGSPRLMVDQGRLMRELRVREEVVMALTRQFEIARVDENRDVPVLNLLDPAVPPAFRTSPKRGTMTVGGMLLGLAIGALLVWRAQAALALNATPMKESKAA